MHRVIRTEFGGRTVIAVAHKLHTILDFDRVIVLDQGRITECDNPRELLATPTSSFHALYMRMKQEVEETEQ